MERIQNPTAFVNAISNNSTYKSIQDVLSVN